MKVFAVPSFTGDGCMCAVTLTTLAIPVMLLTKSVDYHGSAISNHLIKIPAIAIKQKHNILGKLQESPTVCGYSICFVEEMILKSKI